MTKHTASWGISELLDRYIGLAQRPSQRDGTFVISGALSFTATGDDGKDSITETYDVRISVPPKFPKDVPLVRELGNRIPASFHTLRHGHLCLGAPLKLLLLLKQRPNLLGFVETCLVPYLYNFHRSQGNLPFGELEHGPRGLLDEYRVILKVKNDDACVSLLWLAGMKKRIANKCLCPCGSGRRVGRCHNLILNNIRRLAPRGWFHTHCDYLTPEP